jgi:hypothetical protein
MTNYVSLNDKEHANLKVITTRSAKFGDNVNYAMTFPFEFRNIQSYYPIFFQKESNSGTFFPLALFGFEKEENLFLSDDHWDAGYVPIMIRRQPFLIGFQADAEDPTKKNPIVSIDLDNPRVNDSEGETLFLEHGGTSEFLQKATANLELIHQASEHSKQFVDALIQFDLLESVTINIELLDGSSNQLLGYYTINEELVQKLNGEQLAELNSKGFLQPIFMVLASHTAIRTLIERKNHSVKS